MKMRQTFAPSVHPWEEVFYDGQALVVGNIITLPKGKEHWANELYFRGFELIQEETQDVAAEATPQPATRNKRKVKNGNNKE